jgi:cell division protein FtsQ
MSRRISVLATKKSKTRGATKRRQPFPFQLVFLWVKRTAAVTLVVGLLVVFSRLIMNVSWQPMAVKGFELETTLVYQNREPLEELLKSYEGTSLIFLDADQLNRQINGLPWISRTTVQKSWPGTIRIRVVEHEPVAIWNETSVLNSDGKPLEKPVAEMALARLRGPEGAPEKVMEHYLQFSQIFKEYGHQIVQVTMKARGAWSLKTQEGIEIQLGEKNVLERSRRIVNVLTHSGLPDLDIEYIDARYPNGIAIKFTESDSAEVLEDDIAA